MDFDEMKKKLSSRLKDNRYKHSVGVSDTAVFLAKRFDVDVEKSRIAGLLHDCARQFKNDELIAEAERRNIEIGQIEREMPVLLHATVGAQMIADEYEVDDREIAQSILYHTVGGCNMTDLDKIIYFADMIEPNRDYHGVGKLRKMAKKSSLDDMFFEGLQQSMKFVVKKAAIIHPGTVAAYNDILFRRLAAKRQ